jgi:hypothetical protein
MTKGVSKMGRTVRECDRGREVVSRLLKELEYIEGKISEIVTVLVNCADKTTEEEIEEDLNRVYTELENLRFEIEHYCIGDCSLCTKNCNIDCNIDCYDCVRFYKCIEEKKLVLV